MSGCQHAVVPRRPEPEHVTRLVWAVHDMLDAVDATLPHACPPLVRSAAGALLEATARYHRDSGYPERPARPEEAA